MATEAIAALVTAAQSGDRRALDTLLSRHLPLLYGVIGRPGHRSGRG
jgi:hypothetical protein